MASDQEAPGPGGGDLAVELSREAAATTANAKSHDDLQNASILPIEAEQQIGQQRGPELVEDEAKRAAPLEEVPQAAGETATGAGGTGNDGSAVPARTGRGGQPATSAASVGSEPLKRIDRPWLAHTQNTTNQGAAVQLPNGQDIPDPRSPTGHLMSPVASLSAVAEAGRETRAAYLSLLNNPETALGAAPYLVTSLGINLGHGGTFDYQRKGNHVTGFTQFPQFKNVSNVNVGLFSQQAGLTLNETLKAAGTFAKLFSSNARPNQPHGLEPETAQFITTGFNLGKSGVFNQPTTP